MPRLVRRMCDTAGPPRARMGGSITKARMPRSGCEGWRSSTSPGGQQPVYNEDRTVAAVFNGEIYNFGELREELRRRGHRIVTTGTSECIVHLYEDYGETRWSTTCGACSPSPSGMRARAALLLARDRVGKKPLYWRDDGRSPDLRLGTQGTRG